MKRKRLNTTRGKSRKNKTNDDVINVIQNKQ